MKNTKATIVATLTCLLFLISTSTLSGQDNHQSRIDSLMQLMTIDEKIGQLNLVNPGGGAATGAVVSQGVEDKIKSGQVGALFGARGAARVRRIQDLAVEQSRLGIPLLIGLDVIHGHQTIFPIPLGISCSWDLDLIRESAQRAAAEATADGLCWVFSPMVDVARDPRWGRVAEGAGEDPYLGAQIARAMVQGYQGENLADPLTVMACVKHFALYGASEAGRDYNTVDMSRIQMFQNYFTPYKAAIDAGVGSVMTSFNDVDGVPATGNRWLLTELLREQWGFEGLITSDYTSVNEMIAHGMGDLSQVSALALKAGLDMDMVGEGFLTTLKGSLESGDITEEDIDRACGNVLMAKFKLGLFDDPYRYIDESRVDEILSPEHRQFARSIAARSMVLLKNDQQVLPLTKESKIALIGPLANSHNNMLGTWAVSGDLSKSVTVLQGMQSVAGDGSNVSFAKGSNITNDTTLAKKANVFGTRVAIDERTPQEMISEAVDLAHNSEVVVAVVGEASEMSGEAASRTRLDLPPAQVEMIQALKATGKPLILVIMSGRPLTISREVDLADGVLQAWFAGTESGNAIADVLYGDYNPSGKLTMTFPRHVGQIPIYYNHKNTGRPFNNSKFTTQYLDESNEPLFPFGYGLSYTSFTYDDLQLNQSVMNWSGELDVKVKVTNTGILAGEEVVQLYIRDLVGSVTRPVKELKGFRKIRLEPGDSREVTFAISREDLKFYQSDLTYEAEPGKFQVFVGTNSQENLMGEFTLER